MIGTKDLVPNSLVSQVNCNQECGNYIISTNYICHSFFNKLNIEFCPIEFRAYHLFFIFVDPYDCVFPLM